MKSNLTSGIRSPDVKVFSRVAPRRRSRALIRMVAFPRPGLLKEYSSTRNRFPSNSKTTPLRRSFTSIILKPFCLSQFNLMNYSAGIVRLQGNKGNKGLGIGVDAITTVPESILVISGREDPTPTRKKSRVKGKELYRKGYKHSGRGWSINDQVLLATRSAEIARLQRGFDYHFCILQHD